MINDLTRPEGTNAEDLHLTRRSFAAMLSAGYAVAAFSAEAAPITTPTDGLTIETAAIPNGAAQPLPAFVARPAKPGHHPVILVASEIFGIHDYIKDVCRRLAQAGYVAVAPDFFYRSGVDLPRLEDRDRIMAVVGEASDAQVDADLHAAATWVGGQPFADARKLGMIGFCWGGAVAWRAAIGLPQLRAAVAFYGRLATIIPRAAEVRAPVLGLYGGKDQGIPVSDVEAMRAALKAAGNKSGSELVVYPEAGHGFHADYRSSYDPAAATDGWARALKHFHAHGVG